MLSSLNDPAIIELQTKQNKSADATRASVFLPPSLFSSMHICFNLLTIVKAKRKTTNNRHTEAKMANNNMPPYLEY